MNQKESYRAVSKKKGELCQKCKTIMERRSHANLKRFLAERTTRKPSTKYYFTEWDYCPSCKHVQHYEKYRKTVPKAFTGKY